MKKCEQTFWSQLKFIMVGVYEMHTNVWFDACEYSINDKDGKSLQKIKKHYKCEHMSA